MIRGSGSVDHAYDILKLFPMRTLGDVPGSLVLILRNSSDDQNDALDGDVLDADIERGASNRLIDNIDTVR